MSVASGHEAGQLERLHPEDITARVHFLDVQPDGVMHNAARNNSFGVALLEIMSRRRSLESFEGQLDAGGSPALRAVLSNGHPAIEVALGHPSLHNRAIIFGDRYYLKLFRRLEQGINPELEVGRFL